MAGPEYDKSDSRLALIESKLRSYPDFPKKGILFYDLFSVLGDAEGLAAVVSVIKGWNCVFYFFDTYFGENGETQGLLR